MEFRILGPLEVMESSRALKLGAAKQRSLLAILLIHANEVVSVDRLIDLLWGEEAPETAGNALQVYVSQLRGLLEPGRPKGSSGRLLLRRAPGYELSIEREWLDAHRFEQLVDEGRVELYEGHPESCASAMREALALWRGPALVDFLYDPFAQAEIDRLEGLRMSALLDRITADLQLGRHADLSPELEALVGRHPLREDLRGHLMLALYRSGRQAEALHVYQESRRVLDEELGIDPSTSLQALEKSILLQDPSLELARDGFRRPESLESLGSPAAERCPDCGGPKSAGAPLCADCMIARAAAQSAVTRKTITALCCEVDVGATHQDADPEVLRRLHDHVFDWVSGVIRRHGGSSRSAVGHQVLGLFGVPLLHEDDAARAVRAAVEICSEIPSLAGRFPSKWGSALSAHVGLNTGEALVRASAPAADLTTGDAVALAAKLCLAASTGEILMSNQTRALVMHGVVLEEVGPLALGRRREPTVAFRLTEALDGVPGTIRRLDAPMVGRDGELRQVLAAFERSSNEGTCHLLTVVGAPGVGKSRLAAELRSAVAEDATVLLGRCQPYGEGVTFLPVAEVIRQAAGVEEGADAEDAASAIASVLGEQRDAGAIGERLARLVSRSTATGSVEDLSWAVRKLLEAMARRRPTVVIFDDLHWAEPALLDVIHHISEWTRGVPLLLLCLARPDFLDSRPSWGGGQVNSASLLLEPLSEDACAALLGNLLGDALEAQVRERIIKAADGNPLFIEEMARMLIDDGSLRKEGDRWVASGEVAVLAIPPTIHALLAARIDGLEEAPRRVIERAAVVGTVFRPEAAAALCSDDVRQRFPGHLMGLVRKELIRPDHDDPSAERFRFRHVLIQQAAYERLTKTDRAGLHEQLAEWLEQWGETEAGDEILGTHLERAALLRREVGAPEEEVAALCGRAVELLASSARVASTQGTYSSAVNLYGRAIEMLPPEGSDRLEYLVELAASTMEIGELQRAESILRDVLHAAEATGEQRVRARASIQLWEARSLSENLSGWKDKALQDVADAVEVFTRSGDELGVAKALYLEALVHKMDYRFGLADHALERALEHAEAASDEQTEAKIHFSYAMSSLWGPVRVEDAIERYRRFLDRFKGNRMVEAHCFRGFALLEAMRGRFSEARSLMSQSTDTLRDLGRSLAAATSLVPGIIEMLAGNLTKAEGEFRSSYEVLERAGERSARATAAAYIARALFLQHRYDEAERFVSTSRELAPADDLAARVEWGTTLARILAHRGLLGEADRLSGEVVNIVRGTDDLETQAHSLVARADVVRSMGRLEECASCLRQAVALHERKGNEVGVHTVSGLIRRWSQPAVIDLRDAPVTHN